MPAAPHLVPVILIVVVVAIVIVVENARNAEESTTITTTTTITMGRGKGEKTQLLNSGSYILDSLLPSEPSSTRHILHLFLLPILRLTQDNVPTMIKMIVAMALANP